MVKINVGFFIINDKIGQAVHTFFCKLAELNIIKCWGKKTYIYYIYSQQIMIAYKENLFLQDYDFGQIGIKDENL